MTSTESNYAGFQVTDTGSGIVIVADREHSLVLLEAFNLGIEGVSPAEGMLESLDVGSDAIRHVNDTMSKQTTTAKRWESSDS